jgi:hypothetical protein
MYQKHRYQKEKAPWLDVWKRELMAANAEA